MVSGFGFRVLACKALKALNPLLGGSWVVKSRVQYLN